MNKKRHHSFLLTRFLCSVRAFLFITVNLRQWIGLSGNDAHKKYNIHIQTTTLQYIPISYIYILCYIYSIYLSIYLYVNVYIYLYLYINFSDGRGWNYLVSKVIFSCIVASFDLRPPVQKNPAEDQFWIWSVFQFRFGSSWSWECWCAQDGGKEVGVFISKANYPITIPKNSKGFLGFVCCTLLS